MELVITTKTRDGEKVNRYEVQTGNVGNYYAMSERGKLLSIRETTTNGVYAVFRSLKHFIGYATIEGNQYVVKA